MNTEESKTDSFSRTVESYQTDFTGRLSLPILSHILLTCAGRHANRRGFGMNGLCRSGHTWVLSRFAIELTSMPRQDDVYLVSTWIESVRHMQTNRCFAIHNADGAALGYARSVWAMIDVHSRRPVDLETFADGRISLCANPDGLCPIAPPLRLKALSTAEPADSVRVKYEDIDYNGHVNAIRYIDHVLNLFPLSLYERRGVKRLDVAYLAESHWNDLLTLHSEQAADGSYEVEIRKNQSEPVCRARVAFAEEA